jgi:hypothetical protein
LTHEALRQYRLSSPEYAYRLLKAVPEPILAIVLGAQFVYWGITVGVDATPVVLFHE